MTASHSVTISGSFHPPYNHFQAFQSSTVVTGWEASERSGPDQTTGDDDRRRKVGRFLSPRRLFPYRSLPIPFAFLSSRSCSCPPLSTFPPDASRTSKTRECEARRNGNEKPRVRHENRNQTTCRPMKGWGCNDRRQ